MNEMDQLLAKLRYMITLAEASGDGSYCDEVCNLVKELDARLTAGEVLPEAWQRV